MHGEQRYSIPLHALSPSTLGELPCRCAVENQGKALLVQEPPALEVARLSHQICERHNTSLQEELQVQRDILRLRPACQSWIVQHIAGNI